MKRLRILYHHRTQGRGAEAVHISSIVHALEEMGHSVTVLSPPGIDPLNAANTTPVDKARVRTGGMQTVWKLVSKHLPNFLFELGEMAYNFPAYRRVRSALAAERFDLVYERYAFYLVAGTMAARRAGVPFVLEANEVSGIADRARKQSYPGLCRRFEKALFDRCTGIHTVSSKLKEMILAQGVPEAKVHVVPNAFNVSKVKGIAGRDPALAARLGLAGKRVIGFAGWFDRWDRLDFFIDVFAQVRASHPGVALLLIGDGPVLAEARRAVGERGVGDDVVFTGAVPRTEVLGYLNLLDIAVLPHSNDFGSPVVMFEFMALGKPVVAPRLPPIEDVHRDGDTAVLFKPLDVAQCRAAIERLLDDPGFASAVAGRAYARLTERHTWRRNAELILAAAGLGPTA